jgi:hypothetical protein
MFDYIIIGGGISGLYCVDLLIDIYNVNPHNISIIEKNERWGGRIYTKYNSDYNITYEAGANRFPDNHYLTINLIKKYNLESNIFKINNINDLRFKIGKNIYDIDYQQIEDLMNYLVLLYKNIEENKSELITKTLSQYCNEIFGIEQTQILINSFSYSDDFYVQNAYDGLKSIYLDFNNKSKYSIIKGGFSQLINNMIHRFKLLGVNLRLAEKCVDWKDNDQKFNVIISDINNNHVTLNSKKLILALDQWSLLQLPQLNNIHNLLNSVKSTSLTKIYALFENYPVSWFEGLNKTSTNLPIRMFIPVSYSKGLCILSYTDGYYADQWQKLSLKGDLKDKLMNNIKQLFYEKEIPEPFFIDIIYWNNGAHLWPVNVDSANVITKIVKPYLDKDLYICGESFSNHHGWIQGALEIAEKVCIISNTK